MPGRLDSRLPWWLAGPRLGLVITSPLAFANKRLGILGGVTDLVHGSADSAASAAGAACSSSGRARRASLHAARQRPQCGERVVLARRPPVVRRRGRAAVPSRPIDRSRWAHRRRLHLRAPPHRLGARLAGQHRLEPDRPPKGTPAGCSPKSTGPSKDTGSRVSLTVGQTPTRQPDYIFTV